MILYLSFINGNRSETGIVSSRISLGPILGPVLFIIYTNDLPDITTIKTYWYADDFALLQVGDGQKKEVLSTIRPLMTKDKLLNKDKTRKLQSGANTPKLIGSIVKSKVAKNLYMLKTLKTVVDDQMLLIHT